MLLSEGAWVKKVFLLLLLPCQNFLNGTSPLRHYKGRKVVLAPIHPHKCKFHSNVSSKFCHQTSATIALTPHMRPTPSPAPLLPGFLWNITQPHHDCMETTFKSNQITLISDKCVTADVLLVACTAGIWLGVWKVIWLEVWERLGCKYISFFAVQYFAHSCNVSCLPVI